MVLMILVLEIDLIMYFFIKKIINFIFQLAEAYRNVKSYEKALELFKESYRIKSIERPEEKEKGKAKKSIANTVNNIGMTYLNLKKFAEAIEYYEQALLIYNELFTSKEISEKDCHLSLASIS